MALDFHRRDAYNIALADCKTLASHLASLSEFAALGLHAALWSALIIESEGSQRLPLRGFLQFFYASDGIKQSPSAYGCSQYM